MEKLAQPKEFCPNPACPDYGKRQAEPSKPNLKKIGKTPRGLQRSQCKTGGKTFTETKGTIFYRKHAAEEKILEVLAELAEGAHISPVSRVKGIKEDTLLRWLREAARYAEQVETVLMKKSRVTRLLPPLLTPPPAPPRVRGGEGGGLDTETKPFWGQKLLLTLPSPRAGRGENPFFCAQLRNSWE